MRESLLKGKLSWFPSVDDGIYADVAKMGKTVSMWLEEEKSQKTGVRTIYDGLTYPEIWKIKHAIELTGQEPPLTAIEECFKAAGIAYTGARTDLVGKVYEYADLDTLFPEYFSNKVYAGMLKNSLVPELVAEETVIDSMNFHKIYIEDTEKERQLGKVGRGAELGTTRISVAQRDIYLNKYGRYLEIPYEDVKMVRFNLLGRVLERIGMQIQIDQTDAMIDVLEAGDGNTNSTPATTVNSNTSGTVASADVIEFATCLPTPYKMSDLIGKKALLVEWYTVLSAFNTPQDTFGFMNIQLPMIHEWDRTALTSDYYIGLDRRYAVEHVTTGAVLTESEKIIRNQINGIAISHRDAFSIIDNNAVALFDETHS
jgi:hypothetical protein